MNTNMVTERENIMMVMEGKQPIWVPDYNKAVMTVRPDLLGKRKDPATGYFVDPFGCYFTFTVDGITPVEPTKIPYVMEDVTEWRDHMPQIDLKQVDWETEAAKCKAQIEKFQAADPEGPGRERLDNYFGGGALWEQMHYMMGFENALIALAEEPEECYDFLQAMADFWVEAFHNLCKYYKPTMALLMDHVATATGMMMSPNTYREIIKPAEEKVIRAFREEGVIAQIHCDGDINPILKDFAEIGIQVIQPFQIFNDIEQAKKDYGFVAVGGWDSYGPGNMTGADEETVRQSVRTAMDAYAGSGRYVFWDSGVTGREKEKAIWIADEAKNYGHAFYKNL